MQFQANPPQDEHNEIGYSLLRQCHTEARALLNVPYPPEMLHAPSAPNEAEKRQLQRYLPTKSPVPLCSADHLRSVIFDASARRFQVQKIFLRAAASIKWIQRRQSVLQGRKPQSSHLQALRQADTTLRNVMSISSPEANVRYTNGRRSGTRSYYQREDRQRFPDGGPAGWVLASR